MSNSFDTVCMVGLGYIGLPTAVVFALRGINIVGLDVNGAAVDKINRGETHIVEPGLDDALRRTVNAGYLRATTVPEPADAFLIAVPTPFLANGSGRDDQQRRDLVSRVHSSVLPGRVCVRRIASSWAARMLRGKN